MTRKPLPDPPHTRRVALLRTRDSLLALLLHHERASGEETPRFSCQVVPLGEPDAPRTWAAWQRLAAVRRFDESLADDLDLVLRDTLPAPEAPAGGALPPLPAPVEEDPARRRTARHPRGFKGTKHKPPRRAVPPDIDLRPYLLAPRTLRLVLDRLPQPSALRVPPGADPTLWIHHREERLSLEGLPPGFATHLLPSLRGCSQDDLRLAVEAFSWLDAHLADDLLAAATAVFAWCPPATAIAWCRLAGTLPDPWRAHLLRRVAAHGPSAGALSALELTAALEGKPEDLIPLCLDAITAGLAGGASWPYLRAGIDLAMHVRPVHRGRLASPPPGMEYPEDIIERIVSIASDHLEGDGGVAFWRLHLWDRCGARAGLADLLRALPWNNLSPEAAFRLLRTAVPFLDDEPTDWAYVRAFVSDAATILAAVPAAYRLKAITYVNEAMWTQLNLPAAKRDPAAAANPFLVRTCRPPFEPSGGAADALALLDGLPDPLRRRALDASDSAFAALERACRRSNDAALVLRGVRGLRDAAPERLVDALAAFPGKLMDVARLLGSLAYEERCHVIRAAREHPLGDPALATAGVEALCAALAAHSDLLAVNPIPRRVRDHLEGRAALRPAQTERARRYIAGQLDLVWLDVLEALALRALKAGVASVDPTARPAPALRHALQMLRQCDVNARAFRRFLRAHTRGDDAYRLRHPRTRAWAARHPRVDLGLWTRGVDLPAPPGGLRVELARDPLEALRLGTYAGTCLGLGGPFAFSAVAVVLDVNKQVLYGLDGGGAVVARRLIALSEEERVVTFSIYPESAQAHAPHFDNYVARLAEAMGIEVHDAKRDDEHTIACILSREWYDDGAA